MQRIWRALAGGFIWTGAALVTGCAPVGPDFEPPQPEAPLTWAGPAADLTDQETPTAFADLSDWWATFRDPTLSSLEERAIRSNLDLQQATARIRQARAARRAAGAGLGPVVDATGAYTRSRTQGGAGFADQAPAGRIVELYQSGLDATWELDIFGGVRRSIEAADADLQAAVESVHDVLVSVTAEVALSYIELRAAQERLVIANRNLEAQRHSASLARQRFEAGFASGLDVASAEAQAAATAAQIPLLEAGARQSIYSLSLLLGSEPATLVEELSPPAAIPAASPPVPMGVPSDLLLRRPDIRRSEAEIHAATARIGVAVADLFPRFTISGSGGLQSADFSSAFDWINRFWSIGPAVRWRVFDSNNIRANIELQRALQEESLIAYRRAVLTALQEVESSLFASVKEEARLRSLAEAAAAQSKAVELALILYTEGLTDFLPVLDAQRSLYQIEDNVAQSTRTTSTNLVALYKALGGGWEIGAGEN